MTTMRAPGPTHTAALFRPLHDELVALLRALGDDDWERPTLAKRWRVRDVAAHLLDGDLRRLSFHRDGHEPPSPGRPIEGYDGLVAHLNALNDEWVRAARRLSPAVLTGMLERSGAEVADFVEGLDPFAPALFPVAWAGEDRSLNWMDIGREYTERWHHQQQIRDAVGAPLLLGARWMRPLLELSVRALPRAFQGTDAPPGTGVAVEIVGDGGGTWIVRREADAWVVLEAPDTGGAAPADGPATRIRLSTDVAWRLFYNALSENEAAGIGVDGDDALAAPLVAARAVMV